MSRPSPDSHLLLLFLLVPSSSFRLPGAGLKLLPIAKGDRILKVRNEVVVLQLNHGDGVPQHHHHVVLTLFLCIEMGCGEDLATAVDLELKRYEAETLQAVEINQ